MKNLKMAWRNLWRNKRRTLIAVASIFFGVLLSAFMSSMQEGSYENMVNIAVKFYSGSMQIHKDGYWDNQAINNAFETNEKIVGALENDEHIDFYTPRLESFALASSEEITKGAMVLGIDPVNEDKVTSVTAKLKKGEYLKRGDDGVLVSSGLAKFLKLDILDTLVMISQGYHGVSAAGKYPIRGIIKHPNPEFDKMLVYMDIKNCQEFYSAYDLLSSYAIMVDDHDKMAGIQRRLKKAIGDDYEVMTWGEMQPVLVQQIESDRQSGAVFILVLYLVIGFGILGTIMMMMSERKREMGVMIAIGMKKALVRRMMFFETMLIGFVGVALGVIVALPLVYYFYLNPVPLTGQAAEAMLGYGFEPVMKFSMEPLVFYNQAIIIFVLTFFISFYPLINITKMKVINALRG